MSFQTWTEEVSELKNVMDVYAKADIDAEPLSILFPKQVYPWGSILEKKKLDTLVGALGWVGRGFGCGGGRVGRGLISLSLVLCVFMMSLCVSVCLSMGVFGGVGRGLVSLCLVLCVFMMSLCVCVSEYGRVWWGWARSCLSVSGLMCLHDVSVCVCE